VYGNTSSQAFPNGFSGSTILNATTGATLTRAVSINAGLVNWNLCFRLSRDGTQATTTNNATIFHNNCDNQGATVVVARTAAGNLFGGFAALSWSNLSIWQTNSFLFRFLNGNYQATDGVLSPRYAQFSGAYCPTFGEGHDIYIDTSCRTVATVSKSYSLSTGTYSSTWLTGLSSATLDELEVWIAVANPCILVVCQPLDQCHAAGVCTNGVCSNPAVPDGKPCDDINPFTMFDVCQAGVCGGFGSIRDDKLSCRRYGAKNSSKQQKTEKPSTRNSLTDWPMQ
jgi:hypothetical protein